MHLVAILSKIVVYKLMLRKEAPEKRRQSQPVNLDTLVVSSEIDLQCSIGLIILIIDELFLLEFYSYIRLLLNSGKKKERVPSHIMVTLTRHI